MTPAPTPILKDALILYHSGQFDAALHQFRDLAAAPSPIALVFHLLGILEAKQGHHPQSAAALRQALALQPGNMEIHNDLAGVLSLMERFDEAEGHIQQALKINPNFALAHFNRGANCERRRELAGAEKAYRRALELMPALWKAQYRLGGVLHAQGHFEAAMDMQLRLFEPRRPPDFQPIPRPELANPRIVVVVTCKGRLEHLQQTLPRLLTMATESDYRVVVVDYADPDKSMEWCAAQRNARLAAVGVLDNAELFNLARARNCGANALESDLLCFVDADSVLDEKFLDIATSLVRCEGGLLSRRALTKTFDTCGACCVRNTAYRAVRGYDESIKGYGPEDMDFYARIRQHGPLAVFPEWLYPKTLEHSLGQRTEFYSIKNPFQSVSKIIDHICNKARIINPSAYGSANAIWASVETDFEPRPRKLDNGSVAME